MRQLGIILGFMALAAGASFAQTQLTITNAPPSTGNVGKAYSFQFTASGGSNNAANYQWIPPNSDQGMLPPGLTLSSSGLLSGTPTTVGTYNFLVQVQDLTDLQNPVFRASS